MNSAEQPCSDPACDNIVPTGRIALGYTTCLECGEREAKKRVHCAVPLHKSNYILVTAEAAPELLKGINSKTHRG